MRRGTTPRVTVTAPIDLTAMSVFLTFGQGPVEVTLTNGDFETFDYTDGKTTITASLTQAQTLGFEAGQRVRVQVRAVDADGYALASTIASAPVGAIIREGVIE